MDDTDLYHFLPIVDLSLAIIERSPYVMIQIGNMVKVFMESPSLIENYLFTHFGETIRERRRELGYTQSDLADIIGTNRRFISDLERGKGTSQLGPALLAASTLGLWFGEQYHADAKPSAPELPARRQTNT